MDERKGTAPLKPRYRWPWFVLGALLLGIALAAVWMSFAIRHTRELRESNPLPAPPSQPSAGTKTNASAGEDRIAEFRDALRGGSVDAGRKIFFEKPEASCVRCHKAGGQGGDTGPALDGIGSRQSREYILESMIAPNCRTLSGYESVVVLLKNGSGCAGLLKSETATDLVINTPDEGLITIKKSEVEVRQKGLSPMPEGLGQILSHQDLRDLVEFVASLK